MKVVPEYMENEPDDVKEIHGRIIRNKYLADCDYTQMVDVPMSDEHRALWTTYRQALRDLTDHPDWPNVDLPERPFPKPPAPLTPPELLESE